MRLLLAIALVALPASVAAEVVPLRHGTYVRAGTPCADPPFAAMREWDGIGMADPHSHACRARLLARRGASYTISNSCIGTGVGPGVRTSERLTVVPARQGMRLNGTAFHFCPTASLPPELRRRAVR